MIPSAALFAVHISDNVLAWPWLVGGFAVAAALALVGAWRIREDEIPQVALLTAAFFVASSIHVKVGPGSVHLLLNGLIGVVLGWRACLAIPVALLLQFLLLQHGGFYTLGVNACVMAVPALLAWWLFAVLRRWRGWRHPWFRTALVTLSCLAWVLSCVFSVTLLVTNLGTRLATPEMEQALALTLHPLTLATALVLALGAAWLERRLENRPEFPLGLLLGELTVLATVALNSLVLFWGGEQNLLPALVLAAVHLPLAAIEGVVVGFTVGFLARVKPELLGLPATRTEAISELPPHAAPLSPLPCPDGLRTSAPADRPGVGPPP